MQPSSNYVDGGMLSISTLKKYTQSQESCLVEPPSDRDLQLEEEWMEHTGRRLPEGCKQNKRGGNTIQP